MDKKVTRIVAEDIHYTRFELVGEHLAFVVTFVTKMPIEDVANSKVPRDQIFLIPNWAIHRKDDNGVPCTYFDKCCITFRWGDEKWFLDNITPDTDEFESRVFARMEAYLNQ